MSLNWPQLVAQGRAKDIGIAWTEDELKQLLALEAEGHSRRDAASLIRNGAVVNRADLEAEAKELGIEFAPEAPDTVLEKQIDKAKKPTTGKRASGKAANK